jgi:hypothetical protein
MNEKYNLNLIDRKKYSEYVYFNSYIKEIFNLINQKEFQTVEIKIKKIQLILKKLKKRSISDRDEVSSNIFYLSELYLLLFLEINKFWKLLIIKNYDNSWIFLQNGLMFIDRLKKFITFDETNMILIIENYLLNFEKLYPYVYFFSDEIIYHKRLCSICKKNPLDISCNHIEGELYWGEQAIYLKLEVKIVSFSLVKNPANKRLIVVPQKNECIRESQYRIIDFAINYLEKPFQFFELKYEKRKKPRKFYEKLNKEDLCPCNSNNKFMNCCWYNKEIINPHIKINPIHVKIRI